MEHQHRQVSPSTKAGIDRPPTVRTMQVVAVDFARGEGCCAEDTCRLVTAYYDEAGNLLAEHDPLVSGDRPIDRPIVVDWLAKS